MDRHQASKTGNFHVSDLVHSRHVVVADLEDAILAISLETNVTQKLRDCLAKERLKAVIFFYNQSNEIESTCLIEAELKQVSEIYENSHLFFIYHLMS